MQNFKFPSVWRRNQLGSLPSPCSFHKHHRSLPKLCNPFWHSKVKVGRATVVSTNQSLSHPIETGSRYDLQARWESAQWATAHFHERYRGPDE